MSRVNSLFVSMVSAVMLLQSQPISVLDRKGATRHIRRGGPLMFSVELRINSILIGHLYGHNLSDRTEEGDLYEWRYYHATDGEVREGEIRFPYGRLEPLVAAILGEVGREVRK